MTDTSSEFGERDGLSELQNRVCLFMWNRRGDTLITDIYMVIKKPEDGTARADVRKAIAECHGDNEAFRRIQQYVGAHISNINKKLENYEIVPGVQKRTYKLVPRD